MTQAQRWMTATPRPLQSGRAPRKRAVSSAWREQTPAAGGNWCQPLRLVGGASGLQRMRSGQQVARVLQRQIVAAALRDRRDGSRQATPARSVSLSLDMDVRWGGAWHAAGAWAPAVVGQPCPRVMQLQAASRPLLRLCWRRLGWVTRTLG